MENRELLQRAQERIGAKSQRDLAKALGMNNSSLSLLASGKGELSDETYIKLAKLAGVDPAEIIIEKHMRKAGPEGQKIWAHLAKALTKSAALLLVVVLIMPCKQSHGAISKFSKLSNVYYVKFYFWICQIGEKTTNTLLMLTPKGKHEARKYHTHQTIW